MRHRKRVQEKSQLPSTKRRRLILKQERAVTKGANEALEGASYESGDYCVHLYFKLVICAFDSEVTKLCIFILDLLQKK